MCGFVCVCVFVFWLKFANWLVVAVCVCVCVRERERESRALGSRRGGEVCSTSSSKQALGFCLRVWGVREKRSEERGLEYYYYG